MVRDLFTDEEWDEATEDSERKITNALRLLRQQPFGEEGLYLGHSGGKDSVVIQWLAHTIWPTLLVVHTPKSTGRNATHPLTKDFLYRRSFPVLYLPSDAESPLVLTTQIDGTRISEFDRTDGRSTDVVIDGVSTSREFLQPYVRNGLFERNYIYPIYDWKDVDVWVCIDLNRIPYSSEYDEQACD